LKLEVAKIIMLIRLLDNLFWQRFCSVDTIASVLKVIDIRGSRLSLLHDVDFIVGNKVLVSERLVLRSQDNDFRGVFFKDWA